MQHFYSFEEAQLVKPGVVTVGVFDGVHLGHQRLINRLKQRADANDYQTVVLTFFPHPDVVLHDIQERYYLMNDVERAEYLGKMGVDVVVTHHFDKQTRNIRAVDFVELLVTYLNMKVLVVTPNFALGYEREGNIDFLRTYGQQRGFTVETVEHLDGGKGRRISSTRVREALRAGDVVKAIHFLGRPYRLQGTVVHGEKRGRAIGIPTANVEVPPARIVPLDGVYACRVHLGSEIYNAVTNIGKRPTFDGQSITVEAHLLDFNPQRSIYGETLLIDFIERLRGEIKFDGVEALVSQIKKDIEQGRQLLE